MVIFVYLCTILYRPYLSQVIYKVSHRFVKDHINDMVKQEARDLLRSRQYSVTEISEMLNFNSQSPFCWFFKHATGMTPMKFQDENG